ncbi:isatin hydrolase-like [Patiria miniata]|uniref:Cyclase n=1 Tax=Patiria miniata TaxID=46514 RepID=A0A914BDS1_PATMI|nr:isatin hydrolase-like [Patiria miniata]
MADRFTVVVMLLMSTSALALKKGELLDMSFSFDGNSLSYPGLGFFELTSQYRGPLNAIPWVEYNNILSPEHVGTHMDAPIHVSEGKLHIDEIPLSRFTCPAVRIDITEKTKLDRDYGMTVQDLQDWEEVYGKIPDDCLLFVYTGWGAFYPDRLAYQGTTRNDTFLDEQGKSLVHSPGVAPEAATWLLENRKISGLGLDAPSLDIGQDTVFKTHQILLGANVYGVENVANLDKLPNTGAWVYAFPMKIVGGSGGSVRLVAQLKADTSGAVMLSASFVTLLGLISVLF